MLKLLVVRGVLDAWMRGFCNHHNFFWSEMVELDTYTVHCGFSKKEYNESLGIGNLAAKQV